MVYHANLRKAIALAVEEELIPTFFMADVKRPAISEDEIFEPKFLSEPEAIAIVNAAKGHPLELSVIIGVYYGLRRGEICGLRWSAISFDTTTITVNHTIAVARVRKKGKNVPNDEAQPRDKVVFSRNRGKSKKSLRSLPLVPELRTMLLEVIKRQEYYRELCGNCYSNITQARCVDGKLYICSVLDCFDGAIVGLSMDDNMKAPLCTGALNAAVLQYGQHDGRIIHSDRGSQFTSHLYRNVLESKGFAQSMGHTGSCYDNARMESFFATLKKELIYRLPVYRLTQAQLKSAIFEWIEGYYNRKRRHTANRGNLPPLVKREQWQREQAAA